MQGLYLYGICSSVRTKTLSDIEVGGVGGGEIFLFPYKDIQGIVENVSLEEFGSEEVVKKAVEDVEWIKVKALRHAGILEVAMSASEGTVIPMKFGMIFNTDEALAHSLGKNYGRFKKHLKTLRGKEEWSVKIYCTPKSLENTIKNSSPAIQKRGEELGLLPSGSEYFLQREIDEAVKTEAHRSIPGYLSIFKSKCGHIAEDVKENDILGKELTQKNDPMVFNGAFLLKKEQVQAFQEQIQKLRGVYGKAGFTFELSGPWPPYNFV